MSFIERYKEACQRAGEAGYKIMILREDLGDIHEEIRKINVECHEAQQKEIAAQQQPTEEPAA